MLGWLKKRLRENGWGGPPVAPVHPVDQHPSYWVIDPEGKYWKVEWRDTPAQTDIGTPGWTPGKPWQTLPAPVYVNSVSVTQPATWPGVPSRAAADYCIASSSPSYGVITPKTPPQITKKRRRAPAKPVKKKRAR